MKYWWMIWHISSVSHEGRYSESVDTMHPFLVTSRQNDNSERWTLIAWREITKEEYDLHPEGGW